MGMWRDAFRIIPLIGLFLVGIRVAGPCGEGRLQAPCLRQVEFYLWYIDLAFACTMARRRPKVYRGKVDAATRCSGVCPHIRESRGWSKTAECIKNKTTRKKTIIIEIISVRKFLTEIIYEIYF